MDFKDILNNPLLITSAASIAALLLGWALPNDKLYKMVRPFFELVKIKCGKLFLKFIGEKIDVIDKAVDDTIAEDKKK